MNPSRERGSACQRRWIVAAFILAVLATTGCGGGNDDKSGIVRSLRSYFVFDADPDFAAYCRSFISVHDSETFRHGSPTALAHDADSTETRCRNQSAVLRPNHTGWPDARIGKIQRHGDRASADLRYRYGGRMIDRGATLARIHPGDWRILLAGYD
jgi:hypothetical protein